jgi:hypothetical protein
MAVDLTVSMLFIGSFRLRMFFQGEAGPRANAIIAFARAAHRDRLVKTQSASARHCRQDNQKPLESHR